MKEGTRLKLRHAEKYCEDNDKSPAFMIEYMQDWANVSFDCVMNYLRNKAKKEAFAKGNRGIYA